MVKIWLILEIICVSLLEFGYVWILLGKVGWMIGYLDVLISLVCLYGYINIW